MNTHPPGDVVSARSRELPGWQRVTRSSLLVLQAFVAVTAAGGGVALILGALDPQLATVLSPPAVYLQSSPFSSYLLPGLLLAVIVGGSQAVAFLLGLRRHALDVPAAAIAAIALLIWVFVQMIFIPFSFLQALYFAFGIAELCLILLTLGILSVRAR